MSIHSRLAIFGAALALLAACGGESSESIPTTRSDFATVGSDNFIQEDLASSTSRRTVTNGTGYSYKVGRDDDNRFTALSNTVGAKNIPAPTFSGRAIFTGRAKGLVASRDFADETRADVYGFEANMSVNVDMDQGKFSGASLTNPFAVDRVELEISGDVNSRGQMTGKSSLNIPLVVDTSGEFKGQTGDNVLIGAFHGSDNNDAYAGGLRATR